MPGNSNRHKYYTAFSLIVDALLVSLAIYAFYAILVKPGLPFTINHDKIITETWPSQEGLKNARLISINGIKIKSFDDVEFICDNLSIGEEVDIALNLDGIIAVRHIALVKYYSIFYIIIQLIVYLSFVIPGIYVLIKKPGELASRLFHWLAIFTASFIAFTWGKIDRDFLVLDITTRLLFDFSQIIMSAMILHFSLIFPRIKWHNYKLITIPAYLLTTRFIIIAYYNVQAIVTGDIDNFRAYLDPYHYYIMELSITIFIIAALLFMLHTLLATDDEAVRRKIKWVLFGIFFGTTIYIFLWQIPKLFYKPLIPEWFMIFCTAVAPISFSIAIVRYRTLDIDFIINRSMVYFVAFLIISSVTITAVFLVDAYAPGMNSVLIISLLFSTILSVMIFEAFKNNFQNFIDRKFFKVKYKLQTLLNEFDQKLKASLEPGEISALVSLAVSDAISSDSIGFVFTNSASNQIICSSLKNIPTEVLDTGAFYKICEISINREIIAREDILEEQIEYAVFPEEDRLVLNSDLLLLYRIKEFQNLGILMLTAKKSRFKFTLEEIEGLKIILSSASNAIQKILLQNELILQQEEARRLAAINEMKSSFVSSVSHELKTPLTSIRMFAEIMRVKNIDPIKQSQYLGIIQNECDRLARLINNVLSFSKIEKGMKQYEFTETNINAIAVDVYNLYKLQESVQKFEIHLETDEQAGLIIGDREAILESLINLVSNAIKYSGEHKKIFIKTGSKDHEIFVSVHDEGFGISESELGQIFEPFFRSRNEKQLHSGGTGLGLSIVKNIMDAHGGRIDVVSRKDYGSTFTLIFPRKEDIANNMESGE